MYILRFRESNEIKTIKFCNYESMKYLVNILEQKNIEYVVIKNLNEKINFALKNLLDFSREEK